MSDVKSLVEKWSHVLDADGETPIRDQNKRNTMAVLLENQEIANKETVRRDPTMSMTYLTEAAPVNSMGASSSTASDGAVDIWDPVLISLVRRSMPNVIAYDVCGVQPMKMPTGIVFALRSRYNSQSGLEALFNEANTTFGSSAYGNTASVTAVGGAQSGSDPSVLITSGTYTSSTGMSTAAIEALGDSASNAFNEMGFSIEKVPVVAKGKKLKAGYSNELAQDLKAVHGLDAEAELAHMLSTEILAEINRDVIRSIHSTATFGAQDNTASAGTFDLDIDSNGRWMVERFKGLIYQIERECNAIQVAIRQGKGNFIITSQDVASALNLAGVLDPTPALQMNLTVDASGNTFAGTIFGKIKVYIDPFFSSSAGAQFVTVGYRGTNPFDAGLFYCPYVPLQMFKTLDSNTFQPKIGFESRYGMVAHPFATTAADGAIDPAKKNKFFRLFRVLNLQ